MSTSTSSRSPAFTSPGVGIDDQEQLPADTPDEHPNDFEPEVPAVKRRMLIIVNPYATTVSDRLRHLVVYALQGRFEVDAVDTEARGHATELCREAAHEGYDVVVAFGGDGTVNEAANGLLGSPTPLSCLPGGSANVFAKMLGIPGELVDATEHLLALADDWHPRRVDLGVVSADGIEGVLAENRCFTFASGLGVDANVVQRVDSNPRLKARLGAYYFTWVALGTFARRYLVRPPRMEVLAGGHTLPGVTAIVQNGSPFTYFRTGRSRSPTEPRSTPARCAGACCAVPRRCRCPRSPCARLHAARVSAATARSRASRGSPSWPCAPPASARCRCRWTATISARRSGRATRSCRAR